MTVCNPSAEVRVRDTGDLIGWLVFKEPQLESYTFSLVCGGHHPVPCEILVVPTVDGVGAQRTVLVESSYLPVLRKCDLFFEFRDPPPSDATTTRSATAGAERDCAISN